MRELATVGFLAYFENLLSAADLPGAAHDRSFTQDQISASEALQLVAFKIVSESEENEVTEGKNRRRRHDTLEALRVPDQDRKSMDRNKSKELSQAPPPTESPPETPEVSVKWDSPGTQSPDVTDKNTLLIMETSESTKPLLSGRTPSIGNRDSSDRDEEEEKIDETSSKPARKPPTSNCVPPVPAQEADVHLQVCDSVENLRDELTVEEFNKSLDRLKPPEDLDNERFEFPDPKGDILYTEYELHDHHKNIFSDRAEHIRISRDPVEASIRLRESSKYNKGIVQNAYVVFECKRNHDENSSRASRSNTGTLIPQVFI